MSYPGTAEQAARINQWKQIFDFLYSHRIDLSHAKSVVHRRDAFQLLKTILRMRNAQTAHLTESGRLAGLLLQLA